MDKNQNLPQALLNVIPVGLAFLMPVFFLPLTTEYFEFNKLALLTVSTLIMLILWGFKMFINKSVFVTRSNLDLPLFAFTGIVILATIFSIHPESSIFGSQGRWFPSLSAIISLIAMYYVIASNVDNKNFIKYSLIAYISGVSVSSFVSLLSYFNIYLGSETYLQIQNFTTTGSATTTSILAVTAFASAVSLMLNDSNFLKKSLFLAAAILNLVVALLLGTVATWAVLAVAVLGLALFNNVQKVKETKVHILIGAGMVGALVLLAIVPATRSFVISEDYPQEIKLEAAESWSIVSSVLRDAPILGTGPSTFYLNFPRYRPASLNEGDFWNVRYDKPYSEAFNVIGSYGILGILIVGFVVLRISKFLLSVKIHQDESAGVLGALAISAFGILISLAFTYATALNSFVLFFFLALISAYIALNRNSSSSEQVQLSLAMFSSVAFIGSLTDQNNARKESFHYFAILPIAAMVFAGGYYGYINYAGEYYMRSSINASNANDAQLTYELQARAIQINPRRDSYHNTFAQTNILIANGIAENETLSEEETETIRALIAQSIQSSRIATEVLNPLNVNGWEIRASIYRTLIGVADDAADWSARSYNNALRLDPTNPRLRLDLGGIYFSNENYLEAANLYRQAVQLKSDYANGRYNFAQALKALEAYEDAKRELEIVKTLVRDNPEDVELIAADIASLENLIPTVAGSSDGLSSIDQLQVPVTETQSTQEPLSSAAEADTLNINSVEVGEEELAGENQPQE